MQSVYRTQWNTVTVPYQTMALDAELRTVFGVDNDNFLTTGLIVTNDQAGDSKLKKTHRLYQLNFWSLSFFLTFAVPFRIKGNGIQLQI